MRFVSVVLLRKISKLRTFSGIAGAVFSYDMVKVLLCIIYTEWPNKYLISGFGL